MAKSGKKQRRAAGDVQDYRHEEAKRKNNPEIGLANWERRKPARQQYQYDPYQDPALQWAGKAERLSFEVDTVSLHIHERVSTQAIVEAVRRNGKPKPHQLDLFADPHLPLDKAVEFYQHDVNWSNRLILGDSLLVMNSLLQRELMAGQVQMIYVDPPYGVSYSSNFQPNVFQRDVKDGHDDSLTREPEQIKAYRDTWNLGIHSYLTYLRDRLLLCRDLLHESGSIFVQIGDENLHLVRAVMDEVFGVDNFVAAIAFKKTGVRGAALLDVVTDNLLWYARDKESMKYRQLFAERREETLEEQYNFVELDDGSYVRLTRAELGGDTPLPKGRRFMADQLLSQGATPSGVFPFEFRGKTYRPSPGYHWKTTEEGMHRLVDANRLIPIGSWLKYKRYLRDFPLIPLDNVWLDTVPSTYSDVDKKIYAVQTATKVVERCILMTTDPGDLVFDPTCGSGTTAYVAEQWGRRWITCDTSRVALALARQRLLTATYPYYQLRYPEQGVDSGFVYAIVPHITLKSIAQNKPPQEETLYDKPKVDRGKVRVSGPFTAEAIPIPSIRDPFEAPIPEGEEIIPSAKGNEHTNFILDMIDALRKSGINKVGGGTLRFQRLNAIRSAGILHAEGELDVGNSELRSFAVSFGPRYGPVTLTQVEEAVQQSRGKYNGVAILGFTFDAPAMEFLKRDLPLQVIGGYINNDVLVGDLLKTQKGSQLFTLFGQADIGVEETKKGFIVHLNGVDFYNPQTGEVESVGKEQIAAWFVDEDYDGRTFCISQAFFPNGKNPWEKLQRALKATIDPERFEQLRGMESLPFKLGEHHRIAVKVIDHRGNEMLEVFELDSGKERI